ncbi:copper-containing nitrite reductase [Microbulbifer sp.]|uniref:copper-containing nitrite reductase n=1 Tax=Microbulbifer sp. TaxID=1908541 RepID=UPI003F36A740
MFHPENTKPASLSCLAFLCLLALAACGPGEEDGPVASGRQSSRDSAWSPPAASQIRGEEVAVLTPPPQVPPPIKRDYPTRLIVHLEVQEKIMRLADGVDYTFWTFGGTVPGSFIRARRGDVIEFLLANRTDSRMPHNIDLHAVTGPGGGAAASLTPPGMESVFSFQALNPGLYIYHCATAPVGMHIANGMYGLILVEPEGGLPPVDREYYVVQGEFYTKGKHGERGLQPFDMEKALREQPEYVVFNGSVGALSGDNALRANKGETIRLYVGNGGPSLASSFHVIGEIFDTVMIEGGTTANHNVQTTLIPAGGAVIVEFRVEVPGEFLLVDHSIFRAFNKGALGKVVVEGEEDETLFSGPRRQRVYLAEGAAVQSIPEEKAPEPVGAQSREERIARGERIYQSACAACHMPDGRGVARTFPPLAASDYLNADVERAIRAVGEGLQGEILVNGETYNNVMPRLNLAAEEIANVLTFVYSRWDNSGVEVTPDKVEAVLEK